MNLLQSTCDNINGLRRELQENSSKFQRELEHVKKQQTMLLDHMTSLRAEFEQAEMTGRVNTQLVVEDIIPSPFTTRVELEELDEKLSNQDTKGRMVSASVCHNSFKPISSTMQVAVMQVFFVTILRLYEVHYN